MNKSIFDSIFEPALVKEMHESCEIRHFKEGEVIIEYRKYMGMMPLIISGTVKVLRLDENGKEIQLYYLSSNESCSMAYSCCVEAKKVK
jgi:CRP/FNR family transcriptional regulator, anaerobic regulatory protein